MMYCISRNIDDTLVHKPHANTCFVLSIKIELPLLIVVGMKLVIIK